jgi:hypothetical protein
VIAPRETIDEQSGFFELAVASLSPPAPPL